MKAELVVRGCTRDDMAAVREIYALEVREGTASFELEPPSLAEMSARFAAIEAAGLPYLVAELEGQIAGYAYAAPYRPRPAYRYTVEDSVYVARQARRQGVGRALLEAVIERASAQGMRQMVAIIGDSAHTASIELHARAGFRLVGTLEHVGWKFGRWLDTVIMQRPLGPGAAAPAPPDPRKADRAQMFARPRSPQGSHASVTRICHRLERTVRRIRNRLLGHDPCTRFNEPWVKPVDGSKGLERQHRTIMGWRAAPAMAAPLPRPGADGPAADAAAQRF